MEVCLFLESHMLKYVAKKGVLCEMTHKLSTLLAIEWTLLGSPLRVLTITVGCKHNSVHVTDFMPCGDYCDLREKKG